MTVPTTTLPTREELEEQYKWNAESVFESREAWKDEYEDVLGLLDEVKAFEGRLHEGPETLGDFFDVMEELRARVGRLFVYASMSHAVDTQDQEAASMQGQAGALLGRAGAAASFAKPEMLDIGRETLEEWIQQDPRLEYLGHYIDDLFRQAEHVRSPEVEELLGLVDNPFNSTRQTWGMLNDADMEFADATTSDGESRPVAQSTIRGLYNDPDRDVRRTAYTSYTDGYLGLRNTFGGLLATSVKQDVFKAQAKRFDTALDAALFPNNIPTDVWHNLIDTFERKLPVWHRYWRIRREALGLDELHPYDIWAPITQHEPDVSYEQAVDWISEGLAPLGDEYVEAMRAGCLEEGWVDLMPNKGKRSGAFSSGWKGTHPFILMSWQGGLKSMSTLAHELGHSMHSYLSWRNQPVIYGRYTLFAAEVASNFNQAMTRAHLLETVDDPDFQIAVIEEAMTNFHRYFFIMPTLSRFEYELHSRVEQGQSPSAADMIELMADLFEEGYGGEMSIDRERVGITWAAFVHLYMNYYTYSYATGISGAHALSQRILAGQEGAADAYLDFLKAGGSMYPIDALRMAGVDLATPTPVEETFDVMEGMIDRLEELAT